MVNNLDVKLSKLQIISHAGKNSPDLCSALVSLMYHESILELAVKSTIMYADTGARNNDSYSSGSEEDDVNLQFAEKIYLELTDDQNKISYINDDKCFNILSPPIIKSNNQKEIVTLTIGSKEYLENLTLERRVNRTYEGKISEIIRNILSTHLKTKKPLDIESTLNRIKVTGRIDEAGIPFNMILFLCSKAVPEINSALGRTSGFFFFETSEGYKFKSIDKLLDQSPKRKLIANDTTTIPPGYDGKILNYEFYGGISYVDHMIKGTYNSTLLIYDPVKQTFKGRSIDSKKQESGSIRASTSFAKIPKNLDVPSFFTVTNEDKGYTPFGSEINDQVDKSKEVNFDVEKIYNQSRMRYNQLFAIQVEITIYGDLFLHAGDVVECYFPEVSYSKTQLTSFKKSGKYLISDLCHYVTPNGPAYTKLGLVRDSFGQKNT